MQINANRAVLADERKAFEAEADHFIFGGKLPRDRAARIAHLVNRSAWDDPTVVTHILPGIRWVRTGAINA